MNRADNRATVEPAGYGRITDHRDQRAVLRRIIHAYDGVIVRAYCYIRFIIININMLHILSLCLQRKGRVLTVFSSAGSESVLDEARALSPVSVDVVPVTLKDIFLETVAVED